MDIIKKESKLVKPEAWPFNSDRKFQRTALSEIPTKHWKTKEGNETRVKEPIKKNCVVFCKAEENGKFRILFYC